MIHGQPVLPQRPTRRDGGTVADKAHCQTRGMSRQRPHRITHHALSPCRKPVEGVGDITPTLALQTEAQHVIPDEPGLRIRGGHRRVKAFDGRPRKHVASRKN